MARSSRKTTDSGAPHPQQVELIAALRDPKTHPDGYLFVCDPKNYRSIELFDNQRTIRIKIGWLEKPSDPPLSILTNLGFKHSSEEQTHPFNKQKKYVIHHAERRVRSAEKASHWVFRIIRDYLALPNEHWLFIHHTSNPDEWPAGTPGKT